MALAAYLVARLLGLNLAAGDETASWSHWLRAVLLLAALAIVALLTWWSVTARRGERWLSLSGDEGGVLVPLAALERLAVTTARTHPDVVGATARLRARGGAPVGRLRLQVRPLADAAALAEHVGAEARAAVDAVIGRQVTELGVKTTVLKVEQLKGRLP